MAGRPWNKGLTKATDARVAAHASKMSSAISANWAAMPVVSRSARTKKARDASKRPESIAKMVASKTGKKMPKLAQLAKERFTGVPLGEEHRAKIASALRGKPKSPSHYASMLAHLRRMQTKQTSIEVATEKLLVALDIKHEQQVVIGRFIVDFLVPARRLVIECDGDYWHSLPEAMERDARKDAYLTSEGYTVLRLRERDIRANRFEPLLKVVS